MQNGLLLVRLEVELSQNTLYPLNLLPVRNGGPGCSTLLGAFSENGPFSVETIDKQNNTKAFANPYSWHHLANVLYIEAPIGVGLTRGKSLIKNEFQFAEELYGFYRSFLEVFTEYKGKRVWIFGER